MRDTADDIHDIYGGREERWAREREEEKRMAEARREETIHSAEEGVAEKHARTDRSDTDIDVEAGGVGAHLNHTPDTRRGT